MLLLTTKLKRGDFMDKTVEELTNEKKALTEVISSMDESLAKYKSFGAPEEIQTLFTKVEGFLESFGSLSPKEVSEKLVLLAKFEAIGTVDEITLAIDGSVKLLEEYSDLGTPSEIDSALTSAAYMIKGYKELGTIKEIDTALDKSKTLIESYKELGTPAEIGEALEILETKVVADKCEAIATKFNADSTLIKKMYEQVSNFDTVEALLKDGFGKKEEAKKPLNESLKRHDFSGTGVARISKALM